MTVIDGFLEDIAGENILPTADMCICSGLLQEIEQPLQIIDSMKGLTAENGLIHISVANAYSFHRQLAFEMGLIDSVTQFSDRNKALQQFRVYDLNSLRELLVAAELEILDEGGYFIKPFTHKQMTDVAEVIGEDVLNGLWKLGRKYPELASEIYINARVGN